MAYTWRDSRHHEGWAFGIRARIGYANVEGAQVVQLDSLFRIAIISKPFTAAAILKLIEQGKLTLSTAAFSVLNDLAPPVGANVDSRIYQITIQNLLEHKGGWDRSIAGDPPFIYVDSAATTLALSHRPRRTYSSVT